MTAPKGKLVIGLEETEEKQGFTRVLGKVGGIRDEENLWKSRNPKKNMIRGKAAIGTFPRTPRLTQGIPLKPK